MALLTNSLSGLCVEGALEPGRKLLDECCHQEATGQLKYLAPDRCISRLHEVMHGKPAARQVELDHSKLVIREPPPGFNRVSVSQIVEADRQVFVRLIEANTKPRKDPSGSFPLDAALLPALQSYEVSFSLMHTTGKGSGNSGKSSKRQKTSHGQQQTWGADKGKGKADDHRQRWAGSHREAEAKRSASSRDRGTSHCSSRGGQYLVLHGWEIPQCCLLQRHVARTLVPLY